MFLPLSLAVPPMASMVERRNRNADVVIILLPFRLGLDVVGVVKHNAALFERADVAFVGMLVEGQQHVGLIARAQDFAGTDADLENGRPAGNGGRDGHERHDFLFAAAGQPRQKSADGLDAVLRIAGNANDGLVDFRNLRCAARGRRGCNCVTHESSQISNQISATQGEMHH